MPAPKRPLTAQEKERIVYLASQNTEISEIARELNIDPRRVTGYVRTMINAGRIPNLAGAPRPPAPIEPVVAMGSVLAPPPPQVQPPVSASLAPVTAPQQTYVPPAAPASGSDGWIGGRPVSLNAGGFVNQSQQVKTIVERKIPNDGVLGEHMGELPRERICEIYGSGFYSIVRYEPGKPTGMQYDLQVSEAYGPPRTPKRSSMLGEQNRSGFQRPWGGGAPARPWDRSYERDDEERPPQRPYQSPFSRQDSSLYDYARHNPMSEAAAAATTEAIKQMGASQDKLIEQIEKSRQNGPDTFVTSLFKEQQEIWRQQMTENERRRADERKDEESKWERRQKELDNEYRRRTEEARLAHDREIERIKTETSAREAAAKEERRMLMELEDKKLQVIRDEHKMRQEALQEELKRNREEVKETHERTEKKLLEVQQATQEQIAASNERLEKELERERENLEREHKLKEKAMDQRNALEQQIIDIKKESLQSQGGDQIFQTINTVIKEFSKGLEKIVDLKKLEAMTPEAQAAAVAKGTIDGNVMGDPRKEAPAQAPPPPQQGASPPPNTQAPKNNGNGQGPSAAAPKGEQKNEESQMEQIIQDMLDKPFFKQVIKEWAFHVKTNQDPTTFANMYMEWMRDPLDHEGRKATTMFANFMKPREWSDMMKIIGPKLDKDVAATFKSEVAVDFYDGFKAMVVEQIRDYWEQFLAARKAQRAAQTAAGEAPAPEAPAENPKGETQK